MFSTSFDSNSWNHQESYFQNEKRRSRACVHSDTRKVNVSFVKYELGQMTHKVQGVLVCVDYLCTHAVLLRLRKYLKLVK